jgi:hypothetical protein
MISSPAGGANPSTQRPRRSRSAGRPIAATNRPIARERWSHSQPSTRNTTATRIHSGRSRRRISRKCAPGGRLPPAFPRQKREGAPGCRPHPALHQHARRATATRSPDRFTPHLSTLDLPQPHLTPVEHRPPEPPWRSELFSCARVRLHDPCQWAARRMNRRFSARFSCFPRASPRPMFPRGSTGGGRRLHAAPMCVPGPKSARPRAPSEGWS